MTKFKDTFVGRELYAIKDAVSAETHAAIQALHPSIDKLAAYAKEKGIPALEQLVEAMFAGAATAVTTGVVDPKLVGAAALAAGAPLVAKDVADVTDELHAIATAAVTDVGAALKAKT